MKHTHLLSNCRRTVIATVVTVLPLTGSVGATPAGVEDPLMQAMTAELSRAFDTLGRDDETPVYFMAYQVTDRRIQSIAAYRGAIRDRTERHERLLDVDVRVGSPELDNSRELRGAMAFDMARINRRNPLPRTDDRDAIRTALWAATDATYEHARQRYTKVLANKAILTAETDSSNDFTLEDPVVDLGATLAPDIDLSAWEPRIRAISAVFRAHDDILTSSVTISTRTETRHFVSSEGTRLRQSLRFARLHVTGRVKADDGMEMSLTETLDAADPNNLPDDDAIAEKVDILIANLKALRESPVVEPYTGPAILRGRAFAVFMHETFGHRIEGHRQKSEHEGQTFARKVGERIMPEFVSVVDDPTRLDYDGTFLRGFYHYDDEGVAAQPAQVVEDGVMRGFLMSRSPIAGFSRSNGHGRREPGNRVVARQGNLIVDAAVSVPYEQLRRQLIEECRRQDKPYGLIFDDIGGGFTATGRGAAQFYKVLPLLVYRVYADGRPDEVIRGVDVVGTPLASLGKIIAAADDPAVFNGTCGAESGWVPVSAVAPSVLLSEIEVEKKVKEQNKPPILPPPASAP